MNHDSISSRILLLRGKRVMLDTDLADLYGVPTKVLNQAVKRNSRRSPSDFLFRLSAQEKQEVVTSCDHLARLKFSKSPCRIKGDGRSAAATYAAGRRARKKADWFRDAG